MTVSDLLMAQQEREGDEAVAAAALVRASPMDALGAPRNKDRGVNEG